MSEEQCVEALPWSSLSLPGCEIPWEDLRSIADAAVESEEVRHRLMADVDALLDRRESRDEASFHDMTDLAVPAIFAMVAEKLDGAGKQEAAKFLIHLLYRAGKADDDFLLEAGERAAGRMGSTILDPAMDLLQTHGRELDCWFHVFALLSIAAKADAETRDRVRKFCRRVIREAPDRFERWSSITPAAWTLEAIRDVDSLPLLRTIQQTAQNPELAFTIERLERPDDKVASMHARDWDRPVEEWLAADVKRVHQWLQERETEEDGGRAQDPEELESVVRGEQRAELVRAFEDSNEYAALPDATRDLALSIADTFLTYLMEYARARLEEISPLDVDDVLLDLFPRKVSEDRQFFEHTPVALIAFFEFLEQRGVITDADALKEIATSCAGDMLSRSQDVACWGPAKAFVMSAMKDGVDISDHAAMQRYMSDYNAKLAREQQAGKPVTQRDDYLTRPIFRQTRKVGRNDPCSCGSGKKYKKCCGR